MKTLADINNPDMGCEYNQIINNKIRIFSSMEESMEEITYK